MSLLRYFMYNEIAIFGISGVERLPWQRSSCTCPDGEERGEKYGDDR